MSNKGATQTSIQPESGVIATSSSVHYAEVAIPLHVSQTFTYQLTPDQAEISQVGARIVVPFGRKLVTGYIVALHSLLPEGLEHRESEIKEAQSIVDTIPVCTTEILQITKWVSEYYASPWGEVIKAALPPGISPVIYEELSLTDLGHSQLEAAR